MEPRGVERRGPVVVVPANTLRPRRRVLPARLRPKGTAHCVKQNVDEWMDDRAERPGARVWSPRPSPGQLGMSQEGPDWATERERNTENLKPLLPCA